MREPSQAPHHTPPQSGAGASASNAGVPDAAAAAAQAAADGDITPRRLYLVYTKVTLLGFGGTFFWIRRELVDELKWLTEAEFAELFALGQLIPGGANLFNMSLLVGHRFAGWRGALAAGAGFVSVPFFVMVGAALLYLAFGSQPLVNKALAGMTSVVVGMMIVNAWKVARANPRRLQPWLLTVLAFAAIGLARWPLVSVMVVLAPLATGLAWRELAARGAAAPQRAGTGER
ncbi:MAG: chromate transporter [Burkholderiales bacterium]|nr:chromate transporter [Burkholderiales bacterium]